MKKAFTMVELVFVIVIIGILSAIAIPKLAATRDDAVITKAKVTVASLRSALATERQKNILKGDFSDINASVAVGFLEYGLPSEWAVNGNDFVFTGPVGDCTFNLANNRLTVDTGDCDAGSGLNDL